MMSERPVKALPTPLSTARRAPDQRTYGDPHGVHIVYKISVKPVAWLCNALIKSAFMAFPVWVYSSCTDVHILYKKMDVGGPSAVVGTDFLLATPRLETGEGRRFQGPPLSTGWRSPGQDNENARLWAATWSSNQLNHFTVSVSAP